MSGTREKFNAVFLAAVMVLSMVAFSTAFAGSAAAALPANPIPPIAITDVTMIAARKIDRISSFEIPITVSPPQVG